ncbi:PrsW family intramembrane metalloprotease [Candidatus Peribacteria bacterium]|nr:PrsW family intramembrane metalloprotease [Candidatus Peribacteria bacterium]
MYSIALVALGFAFAENIKYMIDLSRTGASHEAIINNALLRAIFGYLSHTFFSMVCVALYARGRFAFLRLIDNAGNLSLGQKALGWRGYTRLKSIEGFWIGVLVASIIHGTYNIYIGKDVLVPSVILIIGFLFLELFVLHDLRNNTKY